MYTDSGNPMEIAVLWGQSQCVKQPSRIGASVFFCSVFDGNTGMGHYSLVDWYISRAQKPDVYWTCIVFGCGKAEKCAMNMSVNLCRDPVFLFQVTVVIYCWCFSSLIFCRCRNCGGSVLSLNTNSMTVGLGLERAMSIGYRKCVLCPSWINIVIRNHVVCCS